MRLHVDLGSHFTTPAVDRIMQVDNDPLLGAVTNVTGSYLIPSVEGTAISVSAASYVQPVDGGDVSSQVFGQLLARFPQYSHVYFNPLLTDTDLTAIDPSATFDVLVPATPNPVLRSYSMRVKVGRVGAPPVGMMPNSLAVLPMTTGGSPGLVITQNIDLTAATGGVGADDFMAYWKVYTSASTPDIAGGNIGSTANTNQPSFRYLQEIDQEAANFKCFLSTNNGQSWVQVQRLTQVAFCGKTTQVKLAFVNEDPSTTYRISSFALLF